MSIHLMQQTISRTMPVFISLVLAAGCESGSRSRTAASSSGAAGVVAGDPKLIAELDQAYLIGPTIAREIDYRIDWQTTIEPFENSGISQFVIQGDSALALDGRNFLARIDLADGNQKWRLAIGEPIVQIQGISYLRDRDRVYLTAGKDMLVLDSANGGQLQRQRLGQIANTAPAVYGPMMIYGSRNGQAVWHAYDVGHQWKAYQISPSIQIAPQISGESVVLVGSDGRVAALSANTTDMYWDHKLLDHVEAPPAVGKGAVFVAGLDQHLWAFDLGNGRRLWRYLCESPLTVGPTIIDDRVYQSVPGKGLLCFTAVPKDAPGGEVVWTCPNVQGTVLGEHHGVLLCWDEAARRLTRISAGTGHAIGARDIPQVRHLRMTGPHSADIYAAGDDGRIIRLIAK